MIWTLFLDGLIAGLLVITIVLAMILNRRFAGLRRDRLELSALSDEFHRAVARAEDSVARLKTTAASLDDKNRQAERHEDDLRQLIERADAAADRLEAAVRGIRPKPAAALRRDPLPATAAAASRDDSGVSGEAALVASSAAQAAVRSAAERDLLQALRYQR